MHLALSRAPGEDRHDRCPIRHPGHAPGLMRPRPLPDRPGGRRADPRVVPDRDRRSRASHLAGGRGPDTHPARRRVPDPGRSVATRRRTREADPGAAAPRQPRLAPARSIRVCHARQRESWPTWWRGPRCSGGRAPRGLAHRWKAMAANQGFALHATATTRLGKPLPAARSTLRHFTQQISGFAASGWPIAQLHLCIARRAEGIRRASSKGTSSPRRAHHPGPGLGSVPCCIAEARPCSPAMRRPRDRSAGQPQRWVKPVKPG
jgi:hypothetical protein